MDSRQRVPRHVQHGQAGRGGHGHGLDGQPHELIMGEVQALDISVREYVVRQCSKSVVREIDDPQLLQGSEHLGRYVHDVVPGEREDLDVPRVPEAVEVDLHQLVVAQVEPLQVWHIPENTLCDVAQLIVG